MKTPILRTTKLTLKERNVVFVGEMFMTGLLRLTLMGPAEVQAVIELVESYRPDETDTFGTRVAHQRLLELLADIKRDHSNGHRPEPAWQAAASQVPPAPARSRKPKSARRARTHGRRRKSS